MEDDIPLPPESGWGIEIRQLMKERAYDFDRSFAHVMERYLSEGDTRPLMDLLGRGARPREPAFPCLAAMLDPANEARPESVKIRYRFAFYKNRKPGRPKEADAERRNTLMRSVFWILKIGAKAMSENRSPDERFWLCLGRALATKTCRSDFPWTAKLVRVDGRKGRRRDPELEKRDEVLAWFVEKHFERAGGYESAIRTTHEMIEKTAEEEGWRQTRGEKRIREKTIKDAYDARSNGKRPK
jgi:hypothetical protein